MTVRTSPTPSLYGSRAGGGKESGGGDKASPFGRGVTAGDGEGKPMAIELQAQRYAAAFVRAIVPQRGRVAGSVLALSGASRQLSQGESLTGALQNQ